MDRDLTNEREYVTAWNPFEKKLLHISQGTQITSPKDLLTDVRLIGGNLKNTSRYEDEKNALLKAQQKYGAAANQTYIIGHSLGGAITNAIAPSGSHAYTYNAAYAPNQKARETVTNIRTKGDVFSVFAPSENTTTLGNPSGPSVNPVNALLKAHQLENIKDAKIYF